MRIEIKDILDRHKDTPCAITHDQFKFNKQRTSASQSKQLLIIQQGTIAVFIKFPNTLERILFDIIKNAGLHFLFDMR